MTYEPWVLAALADRVRLAPAAAAVSSERGGLTYAELDRQANQVARQLVAAGAGTDDVVLVHTGHRLTLAIGLLGAVKAGAAFCVVDPAIPDDRQRVMRAESGARFIVADHAYAEVLRSTTTADPRPAHIIELDADHLTGVTDPPPTGPRHPDQLAYVVFTSGSTGVPKAIGMPHRCVDNLIAWTLTSTSGEPLRTLQFSALGFDVFVQEVFTAWCSGGCLYLPAADDRHDLLRIHELLRQWRIERLFLPPVALVRLAEIAAEAGEFPTSLRHVAAAGEALRITPRLREFFRTLPGCRLHNHYGPAETHVATAFTLTGSADTWPDLPPIGSAISATTISVRDRDGRPVTGAAVGELYLGGAGVARGYLNGEIGAGRFDTDGDGERWYRTGDLVRDTGGGLLEFCGRADNQVKIRGYRVEPGEIESVLNGHPHVRECAVVAHTRPGTGPILVAYAVLADEVTVGELRGYLGSRLPDYLVPSSLTILDRLPVSTNGKVDRARLPQPASGDDTGVPAVGDVEQAIVNMWTEVLGEPGPGRHTSFFDLGGDSLSAAMVLSRIRSRYDVTVRLQDFLASPTVADLAEHLARREPTATPAGESVHHPQAIAGRHRPSPAQERMWFLTRIGLGSRAYTITFTIDLPLRGSAAEAASRAASALSEIYARHDVLRSEFRAGRDGLWASIAAPAPIPVPVHDLQAIPAAEAQAALDTLEREAANQAMPVDGAPLLRARLLVLARTARLLVTVHHLVFDGLSLDIFARELAARWAGVAGVDPGGAGLDFYAYAADEHARDGELDRLQRVQEWSQLLDGVEVTLELPHSGQRPRVQSFRGSRVTARLDDGTADRVRAFAVEHRVSAYAVFLALFGGFLSRLAGGIDVIVGMPVAGRDSVSSERAIGYFVRTVPVPVRCADDPAVETAVRRAWSASLAARDLADVPLEAVVRSLMPVRDLSRPPLMQALLAYRTAPVAADGQPLPVRVVASESAKFDLTLEVVTSLDEVSLELEYNTDLWDGPAAEQLLKALADGMGRAMATPSAQLTHVFTL